LGACRSFTPGTWPNLRGNANIVPMVANGNVFVASYQTLTIFGPLSLHRSLGSV
jgi:hypothetical protein